MCTIDNEDNSLFLTFDDGPNKIYTPQILELLEAYGQKATFFLIGDLLKENRDVVQAILDGGHSIGSHSNMHLNGDIKRGLPSLMDYLSGERMLKSVVENTFKIFRPPYGYCGWATFAASLITGNKIILWSCDPRDWEEGKRADEIYNLVKPKVVPGAVILLHDWVYDNPAVQDRSETVKAVKLILIYMQSLGIRSKPITV